VTRYPAADTLAARVEAWRQAPNGATMGQIARALFAGESMSSAQAVERFGGSSGLTGQVVKQLAIAGYRVNRTEIPGPSGSGRMSMSYSLDRPDVVPGPSMRRPELVPPSSRGGQINKARRKAAARRKGPIPLAEVERRVADDQAAQRARIIGTERPGQTYPVLGSYLQVRVLALTDDGLVMHLANGGAVYQVRVTGHVEA